MLSVSHEDASPLLKNKSNRRKSVRKYVFRPVDTPQAATCKQTLRLTRARLNMSPRCCETVKV